MFPELEKLKKQALDHLAKHPETTLEALTKELDNYTEDQANKLLMLLRDQGYITLEVEETGEVKTRLLPKPIPLQFLDSQKKRKEYWKLYEALIDLIHNETDKSLINAKVKAAEVAMVALAKG